MTYKERIQDDYFEWLFRMAVRKRYPKDLSFRKLLMHLHRTEFTYTIQRDGNRAEDGMDLRYRFADVEDIGSYLDGPCSVLEMMLALAIRCEEQIMDDATIGDRTGQWFWGMITNLGLGSMLDSRYDEQYVEDTIQRFLNRDYEPNGKGGLFVIRNCDYDLRDVEIWYQLCWYLDSITI